MPARSTPRGMAAAVARADPPGQPRGEFRDGVLVGLSDTTSRGDLTGERNARLPSVTRPLLTVLTLTIGTLRPAIDSQHATARRFRCRPPTRCERIGRVHRKCRPEPGSNTTSTLVLPQLSGISAVHADSPANPSTN